MQCRPTLVMWKAFDLFNTIINMIRLQMSHVLELVFDFKAEAIHGSTCFYFRPNYGNKKGLSFS